VHVGPIKSIDDRPDEPSGYPSFQNLHAHTRRHTLLATRTLTQQQACEACVPVCLSMSERLLRECVLVCVQVQELTDIRPTPGISGLGCDRSLEYLNLG
jgi:hypothetical protein